MGITASGKAEIGSDVQACVDLKVYFVNTNGEMSKGGASVTEVWEGEYDIGSQNHQEGLSA